MAQTILVTGSSSGFGRLTVETLARQGYIVFAGMREEVADAVASVIAQPAGERPLRTAVATVAQRQAPQAVNDAVTHATQSYLEMLDVLPLVTFVPKGEKNEQEK